MDNIAGPPVEGENFFGRASEVIRFVELLQQHDVLLLGARRIGKTSIARAILKTVGDAEAIADAWLGIEVNVASCTDEKAFVKKLARAVELNTQSTFQNQLGSVKTWLAQQFGRIDAVEVSGVSINLGASDAGDWTQLANQTLARMGEASGRWLIYIDELPIFLYAILKADPNSGVQRVRRFLDWFRNDVRALPACGKIRWLVTGSIGLDTLAQREGMADTINSLKHEMLAPFDVTEALAMLRKLAHRYQFDLSDAHLQALIDAVHWPQPYYLQLVFHHLRRFAGEHSGRSMPQLIDNAIDAAVQPGSDNDFHHWEQRLLVQLGAVDAAHAQAMLTLTSQSQAGYRAESLLAALQARMPDDNEDVQRAKFIMLRDILLRDAYWTRTESDGRRYIFRLELLRRWWHRRWQL
jgi:uncharacterized protein